MCGQRHLMNITLPMQYFWTLKRPSILFHVLCGTESLLFLKLERFGITGTLLHWLSDFPPDGFQHVVINGCQSGSNLVQESLLQVCEWCHLWRLITNVEKSVQEHEVYQGKGSFSAQLLDGQEASTGKQAPRSTSIRRSIMEVTHICCCCKIKHFAWITSVNGLLGRGRRLCLLVIME